MGKVVNEKGCVEKYGWLHRRTKFGRQCTDRVARVFESMCSLPFENIWGLSTSPPSLTQAAFVDITLGVLAQETNGCKIQL